MRIEIVELDGIRSHVKSTVPFAKGFNCLVGGLGCGKSSILYAIDFALFGEPLGRGYDYLLREGSDHGKVVLHFVQDGETYVISRSLKRRGSGIGQDFDELKLRRGDRLIANVKAGAVAEQVKAITGLDRELFREVVWVRQERLKEFLNARPRERQKGLDELFGLSDYEKAWSSLAGYQREYEGEKNAYARDPDVVGINELSGKYNRVADEFSLVEIELQDLMKKHDEARKILEGADQKLSELEEVKTSTDELKRKEAQAQTNLMNVKDTIVSLAEKIERNRFAVNDLQQNLSVLGKQIKSCKTDLQKFGISLDQSDETLLRAIFPFADQIASLKGEQESAIRSMQKSRRRLSSLHAGNRCPLCLQPLTEEYKVALMQKIQEENDGWQKTIRQLRHDIKELQEMKSDADSVLTKIQTLTQRVKELIIRMDEESEELVELSNELDEKQRLENELCIELEKVRVEIGKFNTSELEAAKNRREKAFKQYYLLESELRTAENRKKDLSRRLDETKERIDQAQSKIERMQRIAKAVRVITDIRDSYRSIQPKLRSEFVKTLTHFVQRILDDLAGGEGPTMNVIIDEAYTPRVKSENRVEREVSNLSGGERTLLAFAYRLGLGQLIMQSRTGGGLNMLLLDEPTESLGSEDGSINRLSEAISRIKAIEQIIAVTHSEVFAEKARHVIRLEKEINVSKVIVKSERDT